MMPRLRIRCTLKKQRVFFCRYRSPDGRLRQIKAAKFGPVTLAQAREQVARLKVEMPQGRDPQDDKRVARRAAQQDREAREKAAYSIADLLEDYTREDLSKQRRGFEGERILRREVLPVLSYMPASELKRRNCKSWLSVQFCRAPPSGHSTSRPRQVYVSPCERQGRLPGEINPTLGIRGAAQVRRKRYLTDARLPHCFCGGCLTALIYKRYATLLS